MKKQKTKRIIIYGKFCIIVIAFSAAFSTLFNLINFTRLRIGIVLIFLAGLFFGTQLDKWFNSLFKLIEKSEK